MKSYIEGGVLFTKDYKLLSFRELSDSELIEVREVMSKRLRSVLSVISRYVSDDDIIAML